MAGLGRGIFRSNPTSEQALPDLDRDEAFQDVHLPNRAGPRVKLGFFITFSTSASILHSVTLPHMAAAMTDIGLYKHTQTNCEYPARDHDA